MRRKSLKLLYCHAIGQWLPKMRNINGSVIDPNNIMWGIYVNYDCNNQQKHTIVHQTVYIGDQVGNQFLACCVNLLRDKCFEETLMYLFLLYFVDIKMTHRWVSARNT